MASYTALRQTAGPDSDSIPLNSPYTWLNIFMWIVLATHGVFSFLYKPNSLAATEDFGRLIGSAILWGIGIIVMARGARQWARAIPHSKLLLALPCVAIASTAWALLPRTAVAGGVYLAFTTVFAIFFAHYFSPLQQMKLVLLAGAIAAVSSLALAFGFPSAGLDSGADVGALQGIYYGKNVCAQATVFFLIPALFYPTHKLKVRFACWVYIAMHLVILVLTRSRTAILLTVVTLGLCFVLKVLRRMRRPDVLFPLLATLSLLPLLGLVFFQNRIWIYQLLGRDASLHGRGPIWEILSIIVARHPWLGYGYFSFWKDPSSLEVNGYVQWVPAYAHNGVLEVMLGIGALGMLFVLLLLLRTAKDAVIVFYQRQGRLTDWYLTVFVLTILYNVDEAFLGSYNSLEWVLFLVASIMLARARRDQELSVSEQMSIDWHTAADNLSAT